jgi:hypothetical protein
MFLLNLENFQRQRFKTIRGNGENFIMPFTAHGSLVSGKNLNLFTTKTLK